MNVTFLPGQVVLSRQGRDAGRYFVVLKRVDENYVLIADGALRKVDKPKRKKIKHLSAKPELISSLGEKLETGARVFDSEIRKSLSALGYLGNDAPCKEVGTCQSKM